MDIYHIAEGSPGPGKRIRHSFAFTALWLLGFSTIARLTSGHWDHPIALVITGAVLFLGTFLTSSWWPAETPSFDLEVDDDEIRMRWNRKIVREVRRDGIRYAREWGTGPSRVLAISEGGPVLTLLGGGIRVPASLPDYEQIKTRALDWLRDSRK
jgi:hypothetical protein